MSNRERGTEQTRRQPEDEFTIYNRVRVLRQDRGLSQKGLAEALGINHRTVGYLEREEYEPSYRLVLKISDFFGVPPEALFSRQPFKPFSSYLQSEFGGDPDHVDVSSTGDRNIGYVPAQSANHR